MHRDACKSNRDWLAVQKERKYCSGDFQGWRANVVRSDSSLIISVVWAHSTTFLLKEHYEYVSFTAERVVRADWAESMLIEAILEPIDFLRIAG